MLVAGIDVEENALCLAYVVAVEQGRVEGIDDGFLDTVLAAGPPHSHDGAATVFHCSFHVAEVALDASVAG